MADTLAPYADKVVVMYTSYVSNQLFEVAWRKLETSLDGKHVQYTKIDGAGVQARVQHGPCHCRSWHGQPA